MATYHVTNPTELQNINNDLTGDYILDNNIDLTGVTWTPIGSSATQFTGTFDGGNFTLSNLTLTEANGTLESNTLKYIGLFGYTECCTIQNLKLVDVVMNISLGTNSIDYTAPLIGRANTDNNGNLTTIKNVSASSTITIESGALTSSSYVFDVSGLVGYAESTSFDTCSSTGDMTITFHGVSSNGYANHHIDSVGGLIGLEISSNLTDCYSTVNLTVNGGTVAETLIYGGLIGYVTVVDNPAEITDCHATGTITADKVNCSGVGGLIGELDTDQVVTISGCHYEGEMTFTNSAGYSVGGLFAAVYGDSEAPVNIEDCYSVVNINYSGEEIIGCAGFISDSDGVNFSKNYSEGTISTTTISAGTDRTWGVAGFAGYVQEGIVENCYSSVSIESTITTGSTFPKDIGGFIGEIDGPSTVENCYSSGDVSVTHTNGQVREVGGFIAEVAEPVTLRNCYSAGVVFITSLTAPGRIGGFIGESYIGSASNTIDNCSWYSGSYDYAIGSIRGTPPLETNIATLAEKSYGTDEPDHTLLQHKEHQVYAQET